MAYKQDEAPDAFALPSWRVIAVTGVDAGAFLHAQTMNDVRALLPGQWQWNGWLNPKGRVIALLALLALDGGAFWMLVPDVPADTLVERLRRYVFRSKVALAVRDDLRVEGAFCAPRHAAGAIASIPVGSTSDAMEFDMSGQGGPRVIRITTHDVSTGALQTSAEPLSWTACDLAHGLPRLVPDQAEAWTPQMLSLERLGAYSLRKGCYPGQEIVARTHYLGQSKRALVRIEGEGVTVGREVRAGDRLLGIVAAAAGNEGLAVLQTDRVDGGWTCGAADCSELPLLDGLAR